jgi:ATP-dependent Lon protease
LVDGEIDVQQMEKRIRGRVKSQMEKSQREYYLNEQMKAIQKELGDLDDAPNELEEIARKIAAAGMPKATGGGQGQGRVRNKLKQMSPMSAEAGVVRNYLDWLLGVPWKKRAARCARISRQRRTPWTPITTAWKRSRNASSNTSPCSTRVKKMKGPILCLVGPPGVGKTSLGQSIAKATNRKFVRMSLGGVRDEAEIRGHRRTYIGSMPGRIVQNLNKVGTRIRCSCSTRSTRCRWISVAIRRRRCSRCWIRSRTTPSTTTTSKSTFDLSEVMFVATANSLNIPGPLLDRMEVIRIPGYTEDEKVNIAMRYLVPKQLKANGLKAGELKIAEKRDPRHRALLHARIRRAQPRARDRQDLPQGGQGDRLGGRSRRAASRRPSGVTNKNLDKYLGVRASTSAAPRSRTKSAWSPAWPGPKSVATCCRSNPRWCPARARMTLTGQLGDVMKESASAALSVVRARAERWASSRLPAEVRRPRARAGWRDPEGRPECRHRDGDRAGVDVDQDPGAPDVAMTGEITLRGRVSARSAASRRSCWPRCVAASRR